MTLRETTPRPRLSAAERRDTILAAATAVFAEHGYRRGRVSSIADRIGVSEPVVFQNFGTKAALYRVVLERLTTTACESLASAAQAGPVSELLAAILSPEHIEEVHAPGMFGSLFADAAGLTSDPDVGDAAKDAIHRVATALADLLAHGRRAGDVRHDLDPVAGAWWLLSLLSARTFRQAVAHDSDDLEHHLTAMTLNLLTTPTDADAPPDP